MVESENNPPGQALKRPLDSPMEDAHPPQTILLENAAVTKIEKVARNGPSNTNGSLEDAVFGDEPAAKRLKLQNEVPANGLDRVDARDKVKGVALVKKE